MRCTLAADINKCPYYDKKTGNCIQEDSCSFQEIKMQQDRLSKEFAREERWYEKFIK